MNSGPCNVVYVVVLVYSIKVEVFLEVGVLPPYKRILQSAWQILMKTKENRKRPREMV